MQYGIYLRNIICRHICDIEEDATKMFTIREDIGLQRQESTAAVHYWNNELVTENDGSWWDMHIDELMRSYGTLPCIAYVI